MIYTWRTSSPLGGILLSGTDTALTGLWFDGQKYYAGTLSGPGTEIMTPVFEMTERWIGIYFSGKEPDFTPPLAPAGTPFRRAVLDVLLTIPYGKTMTYGQIASVIAEQRGLKTMSAQAVGNAVGHNPISIIIPCHRVIGADGGLTGYAGGLERKRRLLAMEKITHDTLDNTAPAMYNE